ncbi:MAG TPA: choice-of-anchor P family protein [Acidimicrobiales bacterium]|nr:choice-of-anchor P family protein [Acidimicrobiales bacterium]
MKSRFLVAAGAALALIAGSAFVSSARADDVPQADVGGGAAGIMADVSLYGQALQSLNPSNRTDGAELTVARPVVTMGKNGGSSTAQIVNTKAVGVSVKAIVETIKGNRRGTPYAQASSTLTDVRGISGALAGVSLGTITSSCLWNTEGAQANTVLVDVNGNRTEPAPNEQHVLPGVGTITFNEQYTDTIYLRDSSGNYIPDGEGWFVHKDTIFVIGAHIHLEAPLDVLEGGTTSDIYLGFTSCDPLVLPSLGGLKLLQTSSD